MALRPPNRARLTPGYVHSMSFRPARLGRRGLDEDDVLDFCARVESELALLLEERASLYAELGRLRGRPPGRNSRPAPRGAPLAIPDRRTVPARPAAADPNVQAVRILAKAQQTADRCMADARAYSRDVAHDAQRRRERILAEASARATLLLEQARRAAARTAIEPSAYRPGVPPPRASHDYPGPAAGYPGNPRDDPGETAQRPRYRPQADRFPF
jgi:cell division septum initiation protein DivIVA